jgi:hypothetical protein
MLLVQRDTFFEFFQAGLRAGFEFHSPALVLSRCRKLHADARRGWMDLSDVIGEKAGTLEVKAYLQALGDAANAVAEMNGAPLAERRLLLDFPARAQAAERPDFTAALFSLLGAGQLDPSVVSGWLHPWKSAFLAAAENIKVDPRIHAARLNYYEKAIRSLLEGDTPLGGLWPLILTWTLAVNVLDESMRTFWSEACHQLGVLGPSLNERVAGLDKYLDDVEIRLDEIAVANGLETSTSL